MLYFEIANIGPVWRHRLRFSLYRRVLQQSWQTANPQAYFQTRRRRRYTRAKGC